MAQMNCIVVTPEETAIEQPCAFVAVPLFDGEKGIGPDHAAMIGRLGYGELRLRGTDGKVQCFYVDGGFVQIAENTVSVMTNRAVPAGDLDASVIREQLAEANSRTANSPELMDSRDRALTQARAQLRMAEKS